MRRYARRQEASMDENERELLKTLNDDEKEQLRNLLQRVYDSIKS